LLVKLTKSTRHLETLLTAASGARQIRKCTNWKCNTWKWQRNCGPETRICTWNCRTTLYDMKVWKRLAVVLRHWLVVVR